MKENYRIVNNSVRLRGFLEILFRNHLRVHPKIESLEKSNDHESSGINLITFGELGIVITILIILVKYLNEHNPLVPTRATRRFK